LPGSRPPPQRKGAFRAASATPPRHARRAGRSPDARARPDLAWPELVQCLHQGLRLRAMPARLRCTRAMSDLLQCLHQGLRLRAPRPGLRGSRKAQTSSSACVKACACWKFREKSAPDRSAQAVDGIVFTNTRAPTGTNASEERSSMTQPRNRPAGNGLPWLSDEPVAARRTLPVTQVAGWLVAAALFAAGAAYWVTLSSHEPSAPTTSAPPQAASATVPLPDAPPVGARKTPASGKASGARSARTPATGKASGAAATAAKSAPGRAQAIAAAKPAPVTPSLDVRKNTQVASGLSAARPTGAKPRTAAATPANSAKPAATPAKSTVAQAKAVRASVKPAKPLVASASATAAKLLAPPSAGFRHQAYNSVVNLAAFRNAKQGHAIWHDVVRAYPAARTLTPGVIQNRDWNGQLFYQFQIGTASLLDSESMCQALRPLDLRCEVVKGS
jgi:hypothetical protein